MSTVLPPEPHRPWFLQRCACACAGDFALATSSLREALPDMARAFEVDDAVTGQSLHHKKCSWSQYENVPIPHLSHWVGTHVSAFRHLQISDHARYLGVEIGPGAADRRWTKAENKLVGVCARIRSTSKSLVQRLVSVKIFALSVLTLAGSVADPDKATNVAENNALQRVPPGCGGCLHND